MSAHGRLTPMQHAVLRAFFAAERDFFLSGGAALAGFHLHHRETTDLDLFTASAEAFERAKIVLPNVLEEVGMKVVVKHDAPGFRRVIVKSRNEELVVDLVRDIGPQHHRKTEIDGIILDTVEEIFSNKLTTLVSRQELRDLVDVFELERHGLRVEDFLDEAHEKDGGVTPATIAFLLSEWKVSDSAMLPPGYSPDQIREFKDSLAERLVRLALPGSD